MNQGFHKIVVLLALLVVMGHSILPHHHEEHAAIEHHHDNDPDHNVFSFIQLDEAFIPSKTGCSANYDSHSPIFISQLNEFNFTLTSFNKKPDYSFEKEFPPPRDYFNILSFRGPPVA